ncbi:uncharacterized protein LOC121267232 [Juglans microcarpa x Juglans regia]|uniref:uncharacterized protein LOC121267232 n=1 Tax=Juglans microcarpa x Juglans regia TaxID=2249226 RepID=UPI001B7E3713|nr:uncharacterized protein LOC121267232 [Juglans microcarpa x Juglans regia]
MAARRRVRNLEDLNENNNERGCTFEQFNSTHPPTFDGRGDSNVAEAWIQNIEEIFSVLECTDHQKIRFATFKLIGEAKRWWNSERAIREADGTGVVSWPHFKQNFFDRFFPKTDREARAREFTNLVQGTLTVRQYAAKFAELSRFAPYLIPDEEKKTQRFEEGLNHRIYERVMVLQIQNFSDLVHKAMLVEQNLKRSTKLQEHKERTTSHGSSSIDQEPWKKRNKGSNSDQRKVRDNQRNNFCRSCSVVHFGDCRRRTGRCFRCGKHSHLVRDCPRQPDGSMNPNPTQRTDLAARGKNQRNAV